MPNVELFDTEYTNMEQLVKLSQSLNEPKWLLERRKNAYQTYQELPYDKDNLFYKYTTFKDFNPKSLTHNWKYNGENNYELVKTYEQNLKPFMVETTHSLQSSLPEDLQKQGVFFDTLHNLIKIDEVKAKNIISMVDKSTTKFDKLGSLSRAFAVNIIVLYVPKNVIITEFIGKITQINNSSTANFGEFIAIFEDGSQATYYNIFNDNSTNDDSKLYSIIETVIVGDNARVKSFQLQDFNSSAVFLLSKYSEINRYGVYHNLSHLQGGHLSRQNSFIDLIGGENIFNTFEGWKPVSAEAILELNPDYIIVPQRNVHKGIDVTKIADNELFKNTKAGKNKNFIFDDAMAITGFGPRTINSALNAIEFILK